MSKQQYYYQPLMGVHRSKQRVALRMPVEDEGKKKPRIEVLHATKGWRKQ